MTDTIEQAVGQICSSPSMTHNLEQCVKLIKEAAGQGAEVTRLPIQSIYDVPVLVQHHTLQHNP